MSERIVAVAIMRDGELHRTTGPNKHAFLQAMLESMGQPSTTLGDVEGYMTSEPRFVTAEEAKSIALASGQAKEVPGLGLTLEDLGW